MSLQIFDKYVAAGETIAEFSREEIIEALKIFEGIAARGLGRMIQKIVNEIIAGEPDLELLQMCCKTQAKITPSRKIITDLVKNDIAAKLNIDEHNAGEIIAAAENEAEIKYIIENSNKEVGRAFLICLYNAGKLSGYVFAEILIKSGGQCENICREIVKDSRSDMYALILTCIEGLAPITPSIDFCRSRKGLAILKRVRTCHFDSLVWLERIYKYPEIFAAVHCGHSLEKLWQNKKYAGIIGTKRKIPHFKFAAGNLRQFTLLNAGREIKIAEFFIAAQSQLVESYIEEFADALIEINLAEKYFDNYIQYIFDKEFNAFNFADVNDLIEMENAFYYFVTPFDEFDFIRASIALGKNEFAELLRQSKYWMRLAANLQE